MIANKSLRNSLIGEREREKRRREDLQRIRGFRLIDDDFMIACFDDNIRERSCCSASS